MADIADFDVQITEQLVNLQIFDTHEITHEMLLVITML
jgi:hypothetical protein